MRVGLVSLDQRWHDKDANFARCEAFVSKAVEQGAELVVFPEMTLTGYSTDVGAIVEPVNASPTLDRFGALARDRGVTIAFGACLAQPDSNRARNEFCIARPDGTSRAIYAKVHPFSFAGEDAVLAPGDRLAAARVNGVSFGASVCYDLRFPELYAALAPQCDAAIVIASWPRGRVAHWRALMVARAIENQFYMFGVNRIGTDGNGLGYEKSTVAVAPDGRVLEPSYASEELDVYEMDASLVTAYRREFPTLRDKRTTLYATLGEHVDVA